MRTRTARKIPYSQGRAIRIGYCIVFTILARIYKSTNIHIQEKSTWNIKDEYLTHKAREKTHLKIACS